jgi:peptidoglycan/xylan/chitin deacetylase (PgdA/CDA1 family)
VPAAVLATVAGLYWYHQRTPFELTGSGCVVLTYHRVIPRPGLFFQLLNGLDDYTLYLDDFEQQIQTLKAGGVHFITPQQLESIVKRRSAPPPKCLLVTLDDADVSQYRYAFPVFKQEKVPFALFVITAQVGARSFKGEEMATWPEIREMAASGLATIGSHTNDLHDMDVYGQPLVARRESATGFAGDLRRSVAAIQHETGTTPLYFAYPYGFGTPQTDEAALRSGMRLLFTLRPGIVHPGDPAFFVKRVMVTSQNWKPVARWAARN